MWRISNCMYAIGPIFSKDWLNRLPLSGNREIVGNWTFASELGGDIEKEAFRASPLLGISFKHLVESTSKTYCPTVLTIL